MDSIIFLSQPLSRSMTISDMTAVWAMLSGNTSKPIYEKKFPPKFAFSGP